MSKTIRAAVYETHGNPTKVLRVVEQPWPVPGAAEAVVRMSAAPINPADINAIEGKYPVRPTLPATPGMEGAGVVVGMGAAARGVALGDLVILPHNLGTWREAVATRADKLVVVPPGIDPVQAAMLKVNPITAWRMLHDFAPLQRGDWFIQNAANSGAGRAAIQIARELGWRSVNLVRRPELIDELKSEGADLLLLDGEHVREEVAEQTGGAEIRLALNAVGGESALRMAKCLAPEGVVVTYGAMSLQPLRIPNGMLIFKNLRFTGFWVNKWYDAATAAMRAETLGPLFEMAQRGRLQTKVEQSYALGDAAAAVAHAMRNKRAGKVVFAF
ncbi:MAG: MDR family NADPH-dependent oxidoreductase [Chthoniobacterales bacterium]